MGKLKKKDVRHVAKLANLKLTSEEIKTFKKQLSEVIDYVEELNRVDTKDVEPTSQTTGLKDVLQDDQIDQSRILSKKEALSGTENVKNDYFVVPAVLTERTDR